MVLLDIEFLVDSCLFLSPFVFAQFDHGVSRCDSFLSLSYLRFAEFLAVWMNVFKIKVGKYSDIISLSIFFSPFLSLSLFFFPPFEDSIM